ncbi:MAG: hypothetical protein EU533_06655 [Promethearchaeota archaeon]|nr:MAG: hypothetical protein EU533_06655 [Candidatus Lokiarchaeota archaeon]
MKRFKRPRCEHCGAKIFPKYRLFRQSIWLSGEIPSYCPDCGMEITIEKKSQINEYRSLLWVIWCILFIVFIFIITIGFQNL